MSDTISYLVQFCTSTDYLRVVMSVVPTHLFVLSLAMPTATCYIELEIERLSMSFLRHDRCL